MRPRVFVQDDGRYYKTLLWFAVERELGYCANTNIFSKNMLCLQVYKDDGMPATICDNCRALMDHSYRFKQICKKADTLLKTYPLTGVWPERLQVPVNLFKVGHVDLELRNESYTNSIFL